MIQYLCISKTGRILEIFRIILTTHFKLEHKISFTDKKNLKHGPTGQKETIEGKCVQYELFLSYINIMISYVQGQWSTPNVITANILKVNPKLTLIRHLDMLSHIQDTQF